MRSSNLLHLLYIVTLFSCFCHLVFSDSSPIESRCLTVLSKVISCLDFASGKASMPSKECCSAVKDIKEKDPTCLCYVIQQVHNGSSPQLKSYGVQEAKLLQLPDACKLANANFSDCPKLLNLTPGSPDYAIFTNSTKAAASPAIATPSPNSSGSLGYTYKPYLSLAVIITIGTTIFISVFPAEFLTIFLSSRS